MLNDVLNIMLKAMLNIVLNNVLNVVLNWIIMEAEKIFFGLFFGVKQEFLVKMPTFP